MKMVKRFYDLQNISFGSWVFFKIGMSISINTSMQTDLICQLSSKAEIHSLII